MGEDAIITGERRDVKGVLRLVCVKCTRQVAIAAVDFQRALAEARRRGWLINDGKEVCPKCPARRPHQRRRRILG